MVRSARTNCPVLLDQLSYLVEGVLPSLGSGPAAFICSWFGLPVLMSPCWARLLHLGGCCERASTTIISASDHSLVEDPPAGPGHAMKGTRIIFLNYIYSLR